MTTSSDAASVRDRLRHEWLQQAQAAFDLLFDPDQQDQLVTFDQRETRIASLMDELACWLTEQHLAGDPAVRPPDGQPALCPKCGQPGQRLTPAGQPLPARQLRCEAGEVIWRREQWRCSTCRVAFFPSGPAARPGH